MNKCGVIYVATGARYLDEARGSAISLKKHHPDLPCTIVTDLPGPHPDFDHTEIVSDPSYSFADKIRFGLRNPYEKILFLDSDTRVTGDISPLFEILETHDFAATPDLAAGFWYKRHTRIPDTFPELNTGVMAYRRSDKMDRLFQDWLNEFEKSKAWQRRYPKQSENPWDQPPLREVLFRSPDIRLCVFTKEFNALQFNGTFVWDRVRVVHGRNRLARFEESINRHSGCWRVYLQQIGTYRGWANMSAGELLDFMWRANAVVVKGLFRNVMRSIRKRPSKAVSGREAPPVKIKTARGPQESEQAD